MSEPKPVWNYSLRDRDGNHLGDLNIPEVEIKYDWNLSPIPSSFDPLRIRRDGQDVIAMALGVPAEYLKPHIGAIEKAQRQEALEQALNNLGMAMADLAASSLFATRTVTELFEAAEQLRMKMIGRRYQAVFALLVVVVYLIVEFLTK